MPNGKFILTENGRHFNSQYYYKRTQKPFEENDLSPWLSYSPTLHHAYCHYCWLFGNEDTKKGIWCTGYTDWKHVQRSISIHSLSKTHLQNAVAAASFLKKADISHQLNQQINEEAKKWRYVVNIFFDTIRTLSGLGVAFRGHREKMDEENPGIYLFRFLTTLLGMLSRFLMTLLGSCLKNIYSKKFIYVVKLSMARPLCQES